MPHPFQTMNVGTEWLVEAAGCREDALRDVPRLGDLFARVIDELQLRPLHDPAWHVFPGAGGVTGFVMLTESHLACHTYPEHGLITINLYCCREREEWPWTERLTELLGASDVRVRVLERTLTRSQERSTTRSQERSTTRSQERSTTRSQERST